jgi:hypothetical protein
MALTLYQITLHQSTVCLFIAAILSKELAAEGYCDSVLVTMHIVCTETIDGVQIDGSHVLLSRVWPVLIDILCHKITLIEGLCNSIFCHRFRMPPVGLHVLAGLDMLDEFLTVDPDTQFGVE